MSFCAQFCVFFGGYVSGWKKVPRFPPKVRNFIAAPHIVESDWWRRRDAIKDEPQEFTRKSVAIATRHGIPHFAFRAGITKMIVYFDKVDLTRRGRVSQGCPTLSFSTSRSTRSFPLSTSSRSTFFFSFFSFRSFVSFFPSFIAW